MPQLEKKRIPLVPVCEMLHPYWITAVQEVQCEQYLFKSIPVAFNKTIKRVIQLLSAICSFSQFSHDKCCT